MSEIPSELYYAESHEWVEQLDDGLLRIGISDHAQEQLGDLVFIELPELGSAVSQGDACAVVESVKAASDVYAPVSGEVVSINETLAEEPEVVNNDPYGDGWLFTVKPSDLDELQNLMDAAGYKAHIDE